MFNLQSMKIASMVWLFQVHTAAAAAAAVNQFLKAHMSDWIEWNIQL